MSQSAIDKAIKQLWQIVEDVEAGRLAKRHDAGAASAARANVDEVLAAAIDAAMATGCTRDVAIMRVAKQHPRLLEIHKRLVEAGVTRTRKADAEAPPPKPSRHHEASVAVLEHAKELVASGQYPDIIAAMGDRRMFPFLQRWTETSGT